MGAAVRTRVEPERRPPALLDRHGRDAGCRREHVDPFTVRLQDCEFRLADEAGLPGRELRAAVRRQRLAYRDVASATNRLTLISAIVPPGAVTVHTLFCLKTSMNIDDQVVLCCLLNSFVANYLVRLWVTTHLGTATVERLPVPRPQNRVPGSPRPASSRASTPRVRWTPGGRIR